MSENRSSVFISPETVAGQENMIPCGVAEEKNCAWPYRIECRFI